MIISIFYLISVMLLIVNFLMIKKKNEKQNILLWIFLSIVFLFCYNSIVVYILSFINVKSTLLVLGFINYLICLLIFLFFIKNEKIQKYYIKKEDIIYIFIIIFLTVLLGYVRFGYPLKIVYETVDPGTHFWKSLDFMNESILLNKADTVVDFSSRVFGSYVNMGIIFKFFYPFINYIDMYSIYIIYDLVMFLISGIIFYFTIKNIYKNEKFYILVICSIIYMLGYPLNNLIFGFFYLGHAVILINTIILIYKLYNQKEFKKSFMIFTVSILNIGICFTYYLYIPILFASEFLLILINFKKDKKNIKYIFFIIILPLILTMQYFFIPYLGINVKSIANQLKLDGYFYNSWLSNFIVFIPFIFYLIVNSFKNKKLNFEIILYVFTVAFIFLFIVLAFFNVSVHYYSSKAFYILWLLSFVLMFEFFELNCTNLIFKKMYYLSFFLLFIISFFQIENKLFDSEKLNVNKRESLNILDVYSFNVQKIKQPIITFNVAEINIIKDLYDMNAYNVINNFNMEYNHQRVWLNAFFWKTKLNYPENELYTYIIENEYFFDPLDNNNYSKMNENYDFYLVLYRDIDGLRYKYYPGVIPFSIQSRWDKNYRRDYTINNKESYDKISKDDCLDCKFIEYEDGMIIKKIRK